MRIFSSLRDVPDKSICHGCSWDLGAELPIEEVPLLQSHMGGMFAFHATVMSNTLNTPIIVFSKTGSMAILLSHYRPYSTIFAFTNE
ncbi:Pyruvate kinase, C-terminal domain superfamily [Sesbania bispinosa]|nr:Pyruvate kinase, C-terminal domain superfamily [Sesbania bispinosa]